MAKKVESRERVSGTVFQGVNGKIIAKYPIGRNQNGVIQ